MSISKNEFFLCLLEPKRTHFWVVKPSLSSLRPINLNFSCSSKWNHLASICWSKLPRLHCELQNLKLQMAQSTEQAVRAAAPLRSSEEGFLGKRKCLDALETVPPSKAISGGSTQCDSSPKQTLALKSRSFLPLESAILTNLCLADVRTSHVGTSESQRWSLQLTNWSYSFHAHKSRRLVNRRPCQVRASLGDSLQGNIHTWQISLPRKGPQKAPSAPGHRFTVHGCQVRGSLSPSTRALPLCMWQSILQGPTYRNGMRHLENTWVPACEYEQPAVAYTICAATFTYLCSIFTL